MEQDKKQEERTQKEMNQGQTNTCCKRNNQYPIHNKHKRQRDTESNT